MQTPALPIQINSASPAPKNARASNGARDAGGQFSQTLSREMAQHKAPKHAAVAPIQPKPSAPVKAQQQADKSPAPTLAPAPKSAAAEPSRKASSKTESAEGRSDDGTSDASAADAAQGVAAATPVIDMLALVASFNQPAVAASFAAAPADAAVSADPLLAGRAGIELPPEIAVQVAQVARNLLAGAPLPAVTLPAVTLPLPAAALPAVGAAAVPVLVATDKTFTNMMARADGSMPAGLKRAVAQAEAGQDSALALERAAPQTGLERAALGSSDTTATATELAKVMLEPVQAVAVRARDAAAELPAPAELKIGSLTSAPLQQAALGVAQAANGASAGDKIPARVGTPAWDNQVAQKIVWMVAGEMQSASLTLNPPDLGPMQVVLSVTNDMASVTFTSAQPEVRQALEDAMPKLREMMSESGIALGNASVNDGAAGQQQADGQAARHSAGQRAENANSNNGSASDAAAKAAARPVRSGEAPGLVDTFA